MISIQIVIVWIFLLTMYPISPHFLTMKDPELNKLADKYEGNLLNYFCGLTPEESKQFNKQQKQIRRTK